MTSRIRTVLPALALALTLSGCGSGGEATTDPTQAPSASTSESAATTESPSESTETPTVAPATGPRIAVRGLRARVPAGWEQKRPYAVMSAAVPLGQIGTTAYVFRFPNSGLLTLDTFAETTRSQPSWKFKLKRLDDVVLDDQPAFHLAGKVNPGEYIEKFGSLLNDDRLHVSFEFRNDEDQATRDEIIDSVLATVEFKAIPRLN